MNRLVEPEILDDLNPADPAAVRSRRDLRLINSLMGGESWIIKQVEALDDVRRIVELGAGQGELSNQLKLKSPHSEVVAIDLISRPDSVRNDIVWEKNDVLDYTGFDENTVVVANLFIHHLQENELRQLGEKLSRVRAVILAEPHRKTFALWMGRCLFPVVNHVTRHDMITSIKAGFISGEVPALFGLDFQWSEEVSLLGGIRMMGGKV